MILAHGSLLEHREESEIKGHAENPRSPTRKRSISDACQMCCLKLVRTNSTLHASYAGRTCDLSILGFSEKDKNAHGLIEVIFVSLFRQRRVDPTTHRLTKLCLQWRYYCCSRIFRLHGQSSFALGVSRAALFMVVYLLLFWLENNQDRNKSTCRLSVPDCYRSRSFTPHGQSSLVVKVSREALSINYRQVLF